MPVDISDGDRVDEYLAELGDGGVRVELPAGTYEWAGENLDLANGDELVGLGDPGDVVFELTSDATMDGTIGDGALLHNVVVRGANGEPKAGINVEPGANVNGFVWPEGGQQSEDRALYTPDGGDTRLFVKNSSWAWCANNGAYLDKPPVTMENCAALNNNIANVRVGHRDGTSDGRTTYVRDTLIAVTSEVANDDTNSPYSRGLRLRAPGHLVVENCWFVYLDVDGTADLIELHDEAEGSTVEVRNCHFHNDTDGDLIRVKGEEDAFDLTVKDCTFSGSGSAAIDHGNYDGNGVTGDSSVSVPTPSAVTGYAAADEADSLQLSRSVWDTEADTGDGSGDDSTDDGGSDGGDTPEPDVVEVIARQEGPLNYEFTVDGTAELHETSDSVVAGSGDTITENADGTVTVTGFTGNPGYGDAYIVYGEITEFTWNPDDYDFDVRMNGSLVDPAELGSSGDDSDSGGDSGGDTGDGTDGDSGDSDGSSGLTEEDVRAIAEEVAAERPHFTEAEIRALAEEEIADKQHRDEKTVREIVRDVIRSAFGSK